MTQFEPITYTIHDEDEELLLCLRDLRRWLSNMGTVVEGNEVIHCEYISSILHACILISRRIVKKKKDITRTAT